MDTPTALSFLQQAIGLKRVPRTGWMMRGLADVESVAEHAWGTTLVTLILLDSVEAPIEREKALTIALLHDLPESVLSDIPAPATRYLPRDAKQEAETAIMAHLLAALSGGERLHAWWVEFETAASPEGRLVRDADRLEVLLQAYGYEKSRGCMLDEFWENQEDRPFFFEGTQALFNALVAVRKERRNRG